MILVYSWIINNFVFVYKKNDKVVTAFIQEIPKLVKENDGVRCNGLEKKSDSCLVPKISMNCHG